MLQGVSVGSGGAAGWRLTARPSPAVDPSAIWVQVRFGMLRRKSEAGEIRCSGRKTSREDDGRARASGTRGLRLRQPSAGQAWGASLSPTAPRLISPPSKKKKNLIRSLDCSNLSVVSYSIARTLLRRNACVAGRTSWSTSAVFSISGSASSRLSIPSSLIVVSSSSFKTVCC